MSPPAKQTSAQRWRDRRAREAPRAMFDASRHGAEPITHDMARAYVWGLDNKASNAALTRAQGAYPKTKDAPRVEGALW